MLFFLISKNFKLLHKIHKIFDNNFIYYSRLGFFAWKFCKFWMKFQWFTTPKWSHRHTVLQSDHNFNNCLSVDNGRSYKTAKKLEYPIINSFYLENIIIAHFKWLIIKSKRINPRLHHFCNLDKSAKRILKVSWVSRSLRARENIH